MRKIFVLTLTTLITFLSTAPIYAQRQASKAPQSAVTDNSNLVRVDSSGGVNRRTLKPEEPAQSTQRVGTARPPVARPRLRERVAGNARDELAQAEDQYIIYRSGENIRVPLTRGAPLRVSLDAGISTNKMKGGVSVTRLLTLRSPLETPYGGIYADTGFLIETEFSGRKSDFKNVSILRISPTQFQIEVGPTDYIVVGVVDGHYVALKPGRWRFDLDTSLKQVVKPDGETWTGPKDAEIEGMRGPIIGRENKEPSYDPMYEGLRSFPRGELAYGISELKGLFKLLLHRPNIILPQGTDLYFYVEKLTASYIGPSLPTSPAVIIK